MKDQLRRVTVALICFVVPAKSLPVHASTMFAPDSPARSFSSQSNTSNLGVFSILIEAYAGANAITILYGSSSEGDPLITYYPSSAVMQVVSLGNSQYAIVETLGGRCVTSNGISSAITITTCAGASNQAFLSLQSDGSYVIQSAGGTCVDSQGEGTVVQMEACDSSLGQNWIFSGNTPLNLAAPVNPPDSPPVPTPAPTPVPTPTPAPATSPAPALPSNTAGTSLGLFSVLNEGYTNANALSVLYGTSSEGGALISYDSSSPDISVVSFGSGRFEIVETLGGRCMTDNGLGATVTITTCTGASSQLFSLMPQVDGSYIIQSTSGTCISSLGPGTAVEALACNASFSQNWMFSGSTPLNIGNNSASSPSSSSPSSAVPAGYHLTFDDEFQSLNISDTNGAGTNWYTHTIQCCLGDSVSPPAPTYMAGLSDGPGRNPYSLIPGVGLDIRLQKTNGAWYSGVLATVDGTGSGFSQQYGYFEMKANFPAGLGTWPAFWLLNSAHLTQGAPSGEIDVVEAYMQFPAVVDTTLHDYSNGTAVGTHQSPVANMSSGFHTYGMLWTAATMTFYFDGTQIWQVPTPSIMNQPYYPIIDLGLGGGWPTDQTPQQSDMIVQYVRVYAP
jgi:hypothetical protein